MASDFDAYHGEEDEGLGAVGGGLVVADEGSVAYEVAEGAFDYSAASQEGDAAGIVGAFDDQDGDFAPEALDQGGEIRAGVAAFYPREPQPGGTQASMACEPAPSGVLAGVTWAPSSRPSGSISRWRLRPSIFLSAS